MTNQKFGLQKLTKTQISEAIPQSDQALLCNYWVDKALAVFIKKTDKTGEMLDGRAKNLICHTASRISRLKTRNLTLLNP